MKVVRLAIIAGLMLTFLIAIAAYPALHDRIASHGKEPEARLTGICRNSGDWGLFPLS